MINESLPTWPVASTLWILQKVKTCNQTSSTRVRGPLFEALRSCILFAALVGTLMSQCIGASDETRHCPCNWTSGTTSLQRLQHLTAYSGRAQSLPFVRHDPQR